jgi:hypothetical protein
MALMSRNIGNIKEKNKLGGFESESELYQLSACHGWQSEVYMFYFSIN